MKMEMEMRGHSMEYRDIGFGHLVLAKRSSLILPIAIADVLCALICSALC
jgi:hypothetical protein